MNILFIASECAPLAKVGGLADVVGSLPKALKNLGVDVRVALPKYEVIEDSKFPSKELRSYTVPLNGGVQSITIRETSLPESDVPVYLLDHPHHFGNGGVYIEADASSGGSNAELNRFGLFSRAIPGLIHALGWKPDLIHCHDWQTGALPAILTTINQENPAGEFRILGTPYEARKKTRKQIRTLFTIHNLAYQGIHPRTDVVRAFGDAIASALTPHPHNPNKINFLASAITSADRTSTVSPTYAHEITTPEFGNDLNSILKNLSQPPVGILNSIDTDYWNPATDRFIEVHFGNADQTERAKKKLKDLLQAELKFPQSPAIPLFVMISRLTEQKGFDILIPALRTLLPSHEFQCVILATGDKRHADKLHQLVKQYPRKFHFAERFDEPLAHLLYAAGDFFLMPSRFEPCGLGQMIAMRYGTIPIATAVGGLKDTVKNGSTGFVVPAYTADALAETISRAFRASHASPRELDTLRKNGTTQDFSWKHSAQKYVNLYQSILQ